MNKRHRGIIAILLVISVLLASCSSKSKNDVYTYLGDYSYDSSIIAMLYEDFEGQGLGIVYRRVTDFNGLVTHVDRPILLYFYTSMHADFAGTTAGIEQIAEDYHDKIIVLSVDVFQEGHIAEHYEINAVPDFVILKNGYVASHFDSAQRGQWPNVDVNDWVQENLEKFG